MAQYYLLTSLVGIFLLDEEFKVVDKEDSLFGEEQYEGEWLDAEVKLIQKLKKKDSKATVTVLGFRKGDVPEGAECSDDTNLRRKAGLAVEQGIKKMLREGNIEETQRSIRNSFSEDQLIIHSVRLIDDLNRAMARLGKRFHEWIALHRPKMARKIPDHEALVKAVIEQSFSAKEEMGAEFQKEDVAHLREIASSLQQCYKFREREAAYLEKKMQAYCPNITAISGSRIGGKLLSLAGSLKRMATLPSSTVQLLGAEQALFRHLKNPRAKPPKYGILHEHPLIQKTKRSNHGKVARALADKLSLAARVDFFKGEFIGEKLAKEIEKRFDSW